MNFTNRSNKKELLDNEAIPFEDIRLNMRELNIINTYLGGHKISITGLNKLIGKKKQVFICEIGCGGGDNLLALYYWCKKNQIPARFAGIDIKQSCIDFAKTRIALKDNTEWWINDYRQVQFNQKPDIIFSSLFCHHFSDEELKTQLQWMNTNSASGFFINDLHRHWLAYYSIKLLTAIFSKSYLVKNDAPLSVARGFTKNEWKNLLIQSGVYPFTIQWKWAFRHLIIVKKHLRMISDNE